MNLQETEHKLLTGLHTDLCQDSRNVLSDFYEEISQEDKAKAWRGNCEQWMFLLPMFQQAVSFEVDSDERHLIKKNPIKYAKLNKFREVCLDKQNKRFALGLKIPNV